MTKNTLKQLIRECIKESLNENMVDDIASKADRKKMGKKMGENMVDDIARKSDRKKMGENMVDDAGSKHVSSEEQLARRKDQIAIKELFKELKSSKWMAARSVIFRLVEGRDKDLGFHIEIDIPTKKNFMQLHGSTIPFEGKESNTEPNVPGDQSSGMRFKKNLPASYILLTSYDYSDKRPGGPSYDKETILDKTVGMIAGEMEHPSQPD